jgi:HK97 family phage portal protein
MNWIKRAARRLMAATSRILDMNDPALWDPKWNWFGGESSSGENVTEDSARTISTYFACMRDISEDVAKLPFKVYRAEGRNRIQLRDHPVWKLLQYSPNEDMNAITFRQTLTAHAMGWGGGYGKIWRGSRGTIDHLSIIHPSKVLQRNAGKPYFVRNDDGSYTGIPQDQMIHIHGLGDYGLDGWSVARIGCETLGLTMAAQKHGSLLFKNGGMPSGTLDVPQALGEEDQKRLERSWARFSESNDKFKVAVLEKGTKFTKLGIPPEEGQFLETRQFQVEEICRWFRMPPHKIQHLLRATFSNIEQQNTEYSVDTLMPWLIRWEQEIKRKLLVDESDVFAEHVVSGLLRGDQAARATYYNQMFQTGSMSTNDIREKENENEVEGGDVRFVMANMMPLDQASLPPPEPQPQQPPPVVSQPSMPMNPDEAQAALWPVFRFAALQVIRKESLAFRNAVEKHKGNSSAFRAKMDEVFSDPHWAFVIDCFEPAGRSLVALLGLEPWIPAAFARRHIEEARAEAERMFAGGKNLNHDEDRIEMLATAAVMDISARIKEKQI